MSVWCLVIDHDRTPIGTVFTVACDPGRKIALIKARVKQEQPNSLGNEDASLLEVYHSPAIVPYMDDDVLATAVSELDLSKTKVHPFAVVKDVISDPENMLLIVKKPARQETSGTFKRLQSANNPVDHYLQRSKLLAVAPSTGAKSSHYKDIQNNPRERLLDDRPQPDLDIAPIALLYWPFGEFDDIFTGRVLQPPDDFGIDLPRLEQNVDALANAMLTFYGDEDARRQVAGPLLEYIGLSLPEAFTRSFSRRTDGHSNIEGLVDTIMDIRNEVTDVEDVPYVRSALYTAQSHKLSDEMEEMRKRWRIPALCVTLVGNHIQFYATLLLGHRYRTVSLTPGLSCCPSATNGRDRKHLYSAFAAAVALQTQIRNDLEAWKLYPPEPLPPVLDSEEYFFPAVSNILEYGRDADDQQDIEFKILRYHGQRQSHRYLYAARVTKGALKGREILVKFTRSYCTELHDYCFKQGRAPQLYGFQLLPGGWFVIAMEYLSDARSIAQVTYSSHIEKQLTKLVEGFHKKGLVHGDLRSANILCDKSGEKIWVIDFDWGGDDGNVHYPAWNLPEDLEVGRNSPILDIWKSDDKRILRATLDTLKAPRSYSSTQSVLDGRDE